jgi:hypothetical protein
VGSTPSAATLDKNKTKQNKTMKLKEYAELISKLAKELPDAEVVYAIDDEGNGFQSVSFGPSIGFSNEHHDFVPLSFVRESPADYDYFDVNKPNTVCLN